VSPPISTILEMTRKKILLIIPLAIVCGLLIYTWAVILFTDIIATWRHYVALILFATVLYLFFKSFKKAVVATGIFLIAGTCNLLTLTPSVISNSYGIKIASLQISTPTFQLLSFGILVLFFFMNFDTLVNIQLDYQETKRLRKKE
jgi:hypothetical protein